MDIAAKEHAATKIFLSYPKNISLVREFRRISLLGISFAKPELLAERRRFIRNMLYNPSYSDLVDQEKMANIVNPRELAQQMADNAIDSTCASVNSAIVIFFHTLLDEFIYELCQFLAMTKPDYWDDFIKDRQIKFSELAASDICYIRQTLIMKKLTEMEKKSMLEKMEILLQICAPRVGTDHVKDYSFNKEKVAAFDNLRHDIVHGRVAINACQALTDEEINYLEKTGAFFMVMVLRTSEVLVNLIYTKEILVNGK